MPFPVTLPEDRGTYFIDQNASRLPRYPFQPLFRATASMTPEFRFDDVDIVVNRNSLRKLLDFCNGYTRESFRLNLLLVHNTLFIERCEKNARTRIRGSQNSGWGRNFERAFTKLPSGVEDSAAHHRVLHYALGDLSCVVRFEVDACYEQRSDTADDKPTGHIGDSELKSLTAAVDRLSTEEPSTEGSTESKIGQDQTKERWSDKKIMPQSTAAEIKTRTKAGLAPYLPQLWFGRTPWLIIGLHAKGTFSRVKITDAAAHFREWEIKHQTELRKLVTILTQLREVVQKQNGRSCVAIYEQHSSHKAIKVFASTANKQALSNDMVHEFWVSEKPSYGRS